jgi:hypothetical protein
MSFRPDELLAALSAAEVYGPQPALMVPASAPAVESK